MAQSGNSAQLQRIASDSDRTGRRNHQFALGMEFYVTCLRHWRADFQEPRLVVVSDSTRPVRVDKRTAGFYKVDCRALGKPTASLSWLQNRHRGTR